MAAPAAVAICLLVPSGLAHASTSWNITINGQAIAKGPAGNDVSCGHNPIHIVVGGNSGTFANLTDGTLQVQRISITDSTGPTYLYDPSQVAYHVGGGDATATNSGKTYKITGHIAPYTNAQQQTLKDAAPVPFEFDATCP
jgi:hypothetical protein